MHNILHSLLVKAFRTSVALCLIVGLMPSNFAFADANKLYITPTSSQMNLNTTFTINVRTYADTDQTSGSAKGTLTYPTGQLSVTDVSVSGSGYGLPTVTQGPGTIAFNAARSPAPSGTAQLFSVTFKAIGAGTAVVGFMNTSSVNNSTTTYSGGSYTIISPNPPVTVAPSSSPKPSSSPQPSPIIINSSPSPSSSPMPTDASSKDDSAQAVPDPTGLIDNVMVDALYSTGTVSWKVNTDNPTTVLTYGQSSSQLDRQAKVTKKSDGSFVATITDLVPGLRYSFTISASGAAAKNSTYSGTLLTRGFPVALTITENNQLVQSGQVKIGSLTSQITTAGKLTIGLAAGSYTGTIITDTATLTINLTVATKPIPSDGTPPEAQSFAFNLSSSGLQQTTSSGLNLFTFIGVLFGGTVILAIGFVGFMAYRRRRFESEGSSTYSSAPTVIIEDGYDWRSQPTAPHSTVDKSTPSTQSGNEHHNSVYIAEEQPIDMFDKERDARSSTLKH